MAFEEMVAILRREDYDGKHGPYKYPNKVKAQIMDKVVKTLYHKFGVHRFKEQLRKRWADIKLREPEQYMKIRKVIVKSKYISYGTQIIITSMVLHVLFI